MSSHHALRTGNKTLVIPRPPCRGPPHQGRHYSTLPGLHVRTPYSVPGDAIWRTDTHPRGRYMASLHEVPEVCYSDGLYYYYALNEKNFIPKIWSTKVYSNLKRFRRWTRSSNKRWRPHTICSRASILFIWTNPVKIQIYRQLLLATQVTSNTLVGLPTGVTKTRNNETAKQLIIN